MDWRKILSSAPSKPSEEKTGEGSQPAIDERGVYMPITFIFGPPRTGKSYEATIRKILPAARSGRRIVTNIPLNVHELERVAKKPVDVVQLSLAELRDPETYPWDPEGEFIPGKIIRPGDLVVIDEVHIVFPIDQKLDLRIAGFFRIHGHFFDRETGRSIDILIITQDAATVRREFKFLGELYISLKPRRRFMGAGGGYKFTAYDSASMAPRNMIGKPASYKINLKLCNIYRSFTHGEGGVTQIQDGRAKILTTGQLFYFFVLPIPFLYISASHFTPKLWNYYNGKGYVETPEIQALKPVAVRVPCYDAGVLIGGQWYQLGADGSLKPVPGAPRDGCRTERKSTTVPLDFGSFPH